MDGKKKEKKKKKERGEIDGQLREGIYLLQNHDLCIELGPKKNKKVKGVLLQNHKSSTILSVFYPKMNNKKLK